MADLGLIAPNVVTADGQGHAMLELARAATRAGHRITVYSDRIDDDLRGAVTWRRIRGAGGSQFLYDARFWVAASRASSRATHDAICVMGPCARPRGSYVYYAEFSWLGWRASWRGADAPGIYHRAHARVAALLERRVLAGARAAIAVGDAVAEDLRRAGARSLPIEVVPNGIDLEGFPVVDDAERAAARARFGLAPDAWVIAFIGEYNTTRKGLGPLLAAAARGDEHVLIAGDGSAARASVLDGRAHLVGKVVPVRPVLAAADVVAVPSIYEPFSLVALEAAATGVPLVLSARAGAADHLAEAAVLLERVEPDAIRLALDAVRADPAATAARVARARRAAESLSWPATARAALSVLERIADGGAR